MDQKGLLHEPPETPARITQSAACRQRDPEPTKPLTGRSPNLKPRLPFRQQAPAASEYRPLVLPGFLERPRPDPCAPPRLSHRLDGVLWPRETTGCAETGSPEFPVVLLEVQMHPDPGFHHRLAAQTYRFLQQQPQVEHWAVLVITPHGRLKLGPTKALQLFLQQVVWLSLEELSQQPDLDPQLTTAVSSRGQKSW
ncbi:MAG: DUF2887 domain-containing protein [Cyanobium sp. D14.bin.5]|nr:DUF2887 domain-containing protein [Cyanobium sp. D14.bin.5]